MYQVIADFNPYVMDYFVEDMGEVSVKASESVNTYITVMDDITEIVAEEGAERNIYRVIKKSYNEDNDGAEAGFLGEMFVNNNCQFSCDVCGKAGDAVRLKLFVKQSAEYRLNLLASSDSNELAQLSMFARVEDSEISASMRGTNGEWHSIQMGVIRLEEGEHELEVNFGASNFGNVNLSMIHFLRK